LPVRLLGRSGDEVRGGEGLVQKHEFGALHQGPGDLQATALPTGEGVGLVAPEGLKPQLVEQVLEKYPNKVKLVFKNFPLDSHAFAQQAAVAALSAGRQGKFWEFHDELFKNYNQLNEEIVQQIVDGLKLNKSQFEKDRQDPLLLEIVKHDFNQGIEAGVNSVPTVFVNGRRLKQRSLDGFQELIDKELKNLKINKP